MTTARDLVTGALRKINAVGKGASLDADEAADALSVMNQMLSMWSVSGGMIYAETIETFNLTSGDGEYTIGSGANFNTTKPTRIISAYVTVGTTDYPLIQFDGKQYADIGDKTTSGTPDVFYYDNGYDTGKIKLYPVPVSGTITIHSEKPLASFTNLDTPFLMPPEYQLAIESNLAILMAPEYEIEPSISLMRTAKTSYDAVMLANSVNENNISIIDYPDNIPCGDIYRGYR